MRAQQVLLLKEIKLKILYYAATVEAQLAFVNDFLGFRSQPHIRLFN